MPSVIGSIAPRHFLTFLRNLHNFDPMCPLISSTSVKCWKERAYLPETPTLVPAGHEQMVAGAGAGNVEQMALCTVNILKVGFVGNGLNPLLKRNNLVVTGHDADCSELQPFGKCMVLTDKTREQFQHGRQELCISSLPAPQPLAGQSARRSGQKGNFVRLQPGLIRLAQPICHVLALLFVRRHTA